MTRMAGYSQLPGISPLSRTLQQPAVEVDDRGYSQLLTDPQVEVVGYLSSPVPGSFKLLSRAYTKLARALAWLIKQCERASRFPQAHKGFLSTN